MLLKDVVLIEDNRITNEKIATRGQFPFYVQFFVPLRFPYTVGTPGVNCGGTLIHPKWILTAAHCFKDVSSIDILNEKVKLVWMGHINNFDNKAYKNSFRNIIIHPDFFYSVDKSNSEIIKNDIALGRLAKKYRLNKFVQPVSLSTCETACRNGIVIGIGQTSLLQPEVSTRLRYASVKTTEDEPDLVPKHLTPTQFFSESYIHRGHPLVEVAGGPFICYERGLHIQYGIVSSVTTSDENKTVTVYENVAKFTKFISRWYVKSSGWKNSLRFYCIIFWCAVLLVDRLQ